MHSTCQIYPLSKQLTPMPSFVSERETLIKAEKCINFFYLMDLMQIITYSSILSSSQAFNFSTLFCSFHFLPLVCTLTVPLRLSPNMEKKSHQQSGFNQPNTVSDWLPVPSNHSTLPTLLVKQPPKRLPLAETDG